MWSLSTIKLSRTPDWLKGSSYENPTKNCVFPPFSMMCSLVYLRLYMCEQSVDIALLRDFIIHMGNHWTSVVLLQCLNLVSNCVYYHKWVLPACHQPLIIFGELKVCIQKGILVLFSLEFYCQSASTIWRRSSTDANLQVCCLLMVILALISEHLDIFCARNIFVNCY